MKVIGSKEALARIGYDAEGRRRTWNHRVVRRYEAVAEHMQEAFGAAEQVWLEITEVHYCDGKPVSYAVEMGTPLVGCDPGENMTDDELLNELRDTLTKMLSATCKPILDQKEDFGGDEPSEIEMVP